MLGRASSREPPLTRQGSFCIETILHANSFIDHLISFRTGEDYYYYGFGCRQRKRRTNPVRVRLCCRHTRRHGRGRERIFYTAVRSPLWNTIARIGNRVSKQGIWGRVQGRAEYCHDSKNCGIADGAPHGRGNSKNIAGYRRQHNYNAQSASK